MRPDRLPVLNHLATYRQDPLKFWLETGQKAPVMRIRLGPWLEYWVVTDADFLQHILQQRAQTYIRERRLMALNRMGGPELLFNTDRWEEWLWRRRLMQPAFHRRELASFGTTFVEEAERLADSWPNGAIIDLEKAMKTLTMRIIGRTMFSVDVGATTERLQESFELSSQLVFERASSPLPLPHQVPTPLNRRTKAAIRDRIAILRDFVERRAAAGPGAGDLLDMLITAHLENGRRFSDEELVWEMSGIVFAGHETTALTMMWLFYTLSQEPEIEHRLRAEIDAVLNDRRVTLSDLEHMPFTEQVILETLRLYPPVYVTLREADAADRYQDYVIPKGSRMMLNIRGIQRSPDHWDEPERFHPERFAPDQTERRHKFAFIPFLDGPRKCLGDSFAMMEMRLIVPTILQRCRLHYAAAEPPVEIPRFVMGVQDGMRMEIEKSEPQ
jgi:cytochrome P450